jgi:hypothetical protein
MISQFQKNLVVKWWTEDTHISLNKVEMTRKKMKLSTFEEKPIHVLMETQVKNFTFHFVAFNSYF